MGLPSSVKVLGATYTVHQQPANTDESNVSGLFDYNRRTIYVDGTLSAEVQTEVFYHELIHALLAHTGLEELLDDKTQEALCTGLGTGLARFAEENRE